jgi:hypothetical protein
MILTGQRTEHMEVSPVWGKSDYTLIMSSHLRKPMLCDIAEELCCNILSFLTYDEIICCMLVSPSLSSSHYSWLLVDRWVCCFQDLQNDVSDGPRLYRVAVYN